MATRTTESTNTLETFRVNFNGVVDDIGNVTVSSAGDQLNTAATTVVGAINEIFVGFNLTSQITGDAYLSSTNDTETLTFKRWSWCSFWCGDNQYSYRHNRR